MHLHISQTIDHVRSKIVRLESLIADLMTLGADSAPAGPAPAATANGHAATPKTPPVRMAKHRPIKHPGKAVGPSDADVTARRAAFVAALPQPFGAKDVRTACAIDHKDASNVITQWTIRGWLTRVGLGQYKRTAAFGKSKSRKPSAVRAAPAKPAEDPRAALEKRIQAYCTARDRANADGNVTLSKIHQSQIDKLQAELDDLR